MSLCPVPRIDGPRVYCGPTALASVTGVHPHEVLRVVNELRGDPVDAPIVGMSDYEVCNALGFMGYAAIVFKVKPVPPFKRTSIRAYFEEWEPREACIISTRNHYIVSDGIDALCNQTSGLPVVLPLHPYYRAYAQFVIHVRRRIP